MLREPSLPPATPGMIGRYRIQRELGRGMMGVVYEAVDADSGQLVALKTIEIAFVLAPGERELFEQRFLAEARIVARLSHPGIVAVHDVGRDGATGALYIALEYLDGRTLADVLRAQGRLPWRDALRVTARVAEALHHAHANGVIHRDVKPGNIMLLTSGQPKLMDFGIAKAETARIKLTATGQFFGTPLYLAPEQALGRALDGRADLFSLGSIAYALLTGGNAFAADNVTRIITRVVQHDPPAPSALVPELPPLVDEVLALALAKDPAARYPDGQALADDIEDLLAGRRPRHLAAASRPAAEATFVPVPLDDGELDVESLLAAPEPRGERTSSDLEAQLAKLVADAAEREASARWLARLRRLPARRWALGVVLLLAAAGLVAALSRGTAGERPPGAAAPRLAIELEGAPKAGRLRVWVDRALVAEQRVDGDSGGVSFLSRDRGSHDWLELSPGGHDVEVQLAWADTQKTERLWGDFRPGDSRRLHVKLGGVFKRLSLEWR